MRTPYAYAVIMGLVCSACTERGPIPDEIGAERASASTSNSVAIAHNGHTNASLDRVRFVAGGTLRTFSELDRLARQFLGSNPPAPPSDVPVSFEVTAEQVFVSVNYVQGEGERYWYVKFTQNGEVDGWGTAMWRGSRAP